MKVTLRHIRPPIWRRILVRSDALLGDLHWCIQRAMGWEGSHLHCFDVGGFEYSDATMEAEGLEHEDTVSLDQVAPAGTRFRYEYDFGDSWEHDVVVEKVLPAEDGAVYPRCVAGRRACPPEDCGGPWGYGELLAAIAGNAGPGAEETFGWLIGAFDPEAFDMAALNRRLAPPEARKVRH